jgi:hypothetical protein
VLLFNDLRKDLRKYLAAFLLVMLYASASLASAGDVSLHSDTIDQTMQPTNDPSIETAVGINSDFFIGCFANIRSEINVLERKDMPVGSMNESFEQATAITLRKDGDKIIWSLAPSLDKFSLNPMEDIKNLQLVLKFRF